MNAKVVRAALLLTLAPVAAAQAACEEGDLDRRWEVYLSAVVDNRSIVQNCGVRGADGAFPSVTCGTIALGANDLTLRRNCQITGTWSFEVPTGGAELECEVNATMERRQSTITGRVACDPQPVFLLNMIRR